MSKTERAPFAHNGLFVAAKNFRFNGHVFERDANFPWRKISCSVRRLEQLYNSRYINYDPAYLKALEDGALDAAIRKAAVDAEKAAADEQAKTEAAEKAKADAKDKGQKATKAQKKAATAKAQLDDAASKKLEAAGDDSVKGKDKGSDTDFLK
jgi:hypothetical protein